MKAACAISCVLLVCAFSSVSADAGEVQGDRTITKVIKMLQGMLEKSKVDGEKDVKLFAKYTCFCNSNKEEKSKSIEDLGKTIELLGGQIAEMVGENGKLSNELADLKMRIGDNERARATAETLREKAAQDFVAEEEDMINAVGQMDQAIDTLAAIGADQTSAKASLTALKGTVKKHQHLRSLSVHTKDALKAASVFLPKKMQKTLTAFLQAPFTGTYQSQSGEIVGILKNMRDTFKANLASARAAESAAAESHSKFAKVKEDEHTKLTASYESKSKIASENDETIGSKKTSKAEAETSKADDEEFLGKLVKMCADKTAEYEDRKMVRANEEAAVAQAVSILNSDDAFDTFGKVPTTTTGETGPALLQVSSSAMKGGIRMRLANQLKRSAKKFHSLKLARVALSLEGGNPFTKVEAELDTMISLIDKEEKEDTEQKEWCDGEREDSHDALSAKKSAQGSLEGNIVKLTETIEHVETGLKKQLADEQTKLAENQKAQAEEIEDRGLENAAYQGNVRNLVAAQKVLEKATKVLKKFYDWLHKKTGPHHYEKHAGKDSGMGNIKRIAAASVEQLEEACSDDPSCAGFNSNGWLKSEIEGEEKWIDGDTDLYTKVYDAENPVLLQGKKKGKVAQKEDPEMPDTWEEDEGTQTGKATDVVSMLKFITEETKKEEDTAHSEEQQAQHAFEDTMNDLKDQEAEVQEVVVDLQEQLAEKEKSLEETTIDHEKVTKERKAIEAYLRKIKGGCDFITENIDKRREDRAHEKESLETAKDELQSTPAYKKAKAKEEKEALGACGDKCAPLEEKEQTAACQACVNGISKTAFCAANKGFEGC